MLDKRTSDKRTHRISEPFFISQYQFPNFLHCKTNKHRISEPRISEPHRINEPFFISQRYPNSYLSERFQKIPLDFSAEWGLDMEDYMSQATAPSVPNSWGTDNEIKAIASLLGTAVYVYTAVSESVRMWVPFVPFGSDLKTERGKKKVYLQNLCEHYERVVDVQ